MEIDYIILDSNSAGELELLLDEKALDGYKAVSMSSCYDPNKGIVYTALMVNYGLNSQLEDIIAQISEKLDSISTSLLLIETNTADNLD
ncbi:hypothetical protein [Mucilaginibacter arboris]|uniref:Uncharacterized protein n=1 Tax=Mucilaginibacter arboris TaxID=2682090 RepID=A0A7K1STA3_9SPHI|nr:hypothetical protein [Mucilaginibacter arboris]MVN20539.1 hypothetical protein [Mucilaginibacter arboris]